MSHLSLFGLNGGGADGNGAVLKGLLHNPGMRSPAQV